jgi:predicted RNase H-like nuclease
MSKVFVGVDGCKGGWFAIALTENGDPEPKCFRNISELWNKYKKASIILIDIPIGLRDKGDKERKEERKCDKEARAKLKPPRQSSVFPAPCRTAIYKEADYPKTSKINEQVTGKLLTKQTFAIIPKIHEVDDFLRNNKSARSRIRETHPEICFWGLNSGQAMKYPKRKHKVHDRKGVEERKNLLESVCKSIYPKNYRKIEELLKECNKPEYKSKGIAPDDILDALAAAVTAMLGYKNGFEKLPQKPEKDSQGLPMQMLYYLYKS